MSAITVGFSLLPELLDFVVFIVRSYGYERKKRLDQQSMHMTKSDTYFENVTKQVNFNSKELSHISYNAHTQMLHLDFGLISDEGSCCLHFFEQQQVFSGNYQRMGEGITQIRGKVF